MKKQVKVSGMKCEHCKKAVQKALMGIEGVEGVDIDLDLGLATIESSKEIGFEQISRAIVDAGYQVKEE